MGLTCFLYDARLERELEALQMLDSDLGDEKIDDSGVRLRHQSSP